MTLSVVIATYRRAESLQRTLRTICSQAVRPTEVIVVDQSPTDERAAVFKATADAGQLGLNVRLITSEIPSSTLSRNLGLASATGDWVVFSDDDVDWPENVVADLMAKVSASPDLAMIGARDMRAPSGARPVWRRAFAALFLTNTFMPLKSGKVLACMQARYPQPIVGDMETEWAMGYWFAVDRRFVQEHGLIFDEKMTRYAQAEDMLFSHQLFKVAQASGRRCVVSERIAVAHLVSQEWREPTAFSDLCSVWNRVYIASALRSGAGFWLSVAAMGWAMWHQVVVRILSGRGWTRYVWAHFIALAKLRAIRAGDFTDLYRRHESPLS
jgi:glycosyltransferase involved in cell wall biosynthesis